MNSSSFAINMEEIKSPQELYEIAHRFDWNPKVEFRFWVTAANRLYHEVSALVSSA